MFLHFPKQSDKNNWKDVYTYSVYLSKTGGLTIDLWPLLLTGFNFNPSMDK